MAAVQIAVCLSACLAMSSGMPAGKPDDDGLEKLKNSIADLKQLGSSVGSGSGVPDVLKSAISLSAAEPAVKVDEIKTPSLDELIAKQKTPEVSSSSSLDDILAKLRTPEETKSAHSFDELVAKHKAALTDPAPFVVGLSAADKPAASSASFDLDAAIAKIKAPSADSTSLPAATSSSGILDEMIAKIKAPSLDSISAPAAASSTGSLDDMKANWESLMAKSTPSLTSSTNIMDSINTISTSSKSPSLDEMLAKHKAFNEESQTPILDEIMAKQKSESSLDALKATIASSTPTLDSITNVNINSDSSSAIGGMSFDEIKASIAKSTSATPTLDALRASLAKKAAQVAN